VREHTSDGPNLTAYVGLAVRWGEFGRRENKKLLNEQLFYVITAAINTSHIKIKRGYWNIWF
jgi:hypothetical protein